MDVTKKLAKARVHLLLDSPFFGSLALRLRMVESKLIPTAGTDGVSLIYNPDYVSSLTDEGCEALACHEVAHIALEHAERKGSRLKSKFNVAADLAINSILQKNGMAIPDGWLLPSTYKLEELKSAEWYYEKLPDCPEPKLECPKCVSGNIRIKKITFHKDSVICDVRYQCKDCGHEWDGKSIVGGGGTGRDKSLIDDDTEIEGVPPFLDVHPDLKREDEEKEEGKGVSEGGGLKISPKTIKDWKIYVAEAAHAARMQGKLPGGLEQLITDILRPRIDWREVLRRFIVSAHKSDYVWFPPNKRHLHNGIILPSLKGEGLGDVVVAVDTSGSITDKELKQFLGEIQGILDTYEVTLHMVQCDAAFQGYEEFQQGDVLSDVKIHGRGGTNFGPAFQFVAEKGIEPRCFIYLTDLYGDFPSEAPQYPVLWCVTTEKDDQPFGERIRLEV